MKKMMCGGQCSGNMWGIWVHNNNSSLRSNYIASLSIFLAVNLSLVWCIFNDCLRCENKTWNYLSSATRDLGGNEGDYGRVKVIASNSIWASAIGDCGSTFLMTAIAHQMRDDGDNGDLLLVRFRFNYIAVVDRKTTKRLRECDGTWAARRATVEEEVRHRNMVVTWSVIARGGCCQMWMLRRVMNVFC